jgi:K+-sensing histidine kinase KdpD
MLHEFLTANRAEIIARTRVKVAARSAPRATTEALETGVPLFLDQLAAALQGPPASPEQARAIGDSAAIHGGRLLGQGFTVSQVVHGYGDVCQAVTELAQDTDAAITTDEFRTLNRCLDDAIARAVTEYARLREQSLIDDGVMRAGLLAHELRNRLSAATIGFDLIRNGTVATSGSVSAVVTRNMARMGFLIHRSLVEVRLSSDLDGSERLAVADLIEEAEVDGVVEAGARKVSLVVASVDRKVEVTVDHLVAAGAIANLMQNAFKFTRPGSEVSLRASATAERVCIEVEDQCGGLRAGHAAVIDAALAEQGEDRRGLGLGLFITRKGVHASGGHLRLRDLPGRGCIFTIDLPRAMAVGEGKTR